MPKDSDHGAAHRAGGVRPGGRTARVRRDVLDATLRHIESHGLDGLTIAAIAASAGVAQTTVYRRWPNPPALVADALSDLAGQRNPIPDTGDLRLDLRRLLTQITDLLSDPALARLIGISLALASDPAVAAARQQFWRHRFELSRQLVDQAVHRGQLPPDTSPGDVIETLVAPAYFRLLVTNRPADTDFIDSCVENTMTIHSR